MPTKQVHMEGPATLQTWPLPTPHCTAAFGLLFVFLLMMVHYITCSKVQDPGAIFHFSAYFPNLVSHSALVFLSLPSPLLFVLLLPKSRPQYRW